MNILSYIVNRVFKKYALIACYYIDIIFPLTSLRCDL